MYVIAIYIIYIYIHKNELLNFIILTYKIVQYRIGHYSFPDSCNNDTRCRLYRLHRFRALKLEILI